MYPYPQSPQRPRGEQQIKTYHGSISFLGLLGGPAEKAFQKHAAKLAKQGWRVQNVTANGSLLGKPRNITVVYVRP